MKKMTLTTAPLTTTAILSIMLHLTIVLMKRMIRQATKTILYIHEWLNSQHEFCSEDGDSVKWTGWQYIGFSILTCVICVLLSIKW